MISTVKIQKQGHAQNLVYSNFIIFSNRKALTNREGLDQINPAADVTCILEMPGAVIE